MSDAARTCPDGRMNRAAAAEYLGASVSWLVHADAIGMGPAVVHIGRKVWYRREDLDEFVLANRRESTCSIDADQSGGPSSSIAAPNTVSRRVREIAARLRSERAQSTVARCCDILNSWIREYTASYEPSMNFLCEGLDWWWGEMNGKLHAIQSAFAASQAETWELATAITNALVGVSTSHDTDCLCADCIARRLARAILASRGPIP